MTISPDDDFAAAEYALGTLDAGERATLAARRLREPELDEAIRAWEARLAPLAEAAPAIEPPRDLLPAIEARIRGAAPEAPADAAVVALERSVSALARRRDRRLDHRRPCWRSASSPARRRGGRVPHEYVAILQKDAASPAFAVTVDLDRQELTVRPVAAPRAARQGLRAVDHRPEARRAALAWRDRRQARARREPLRATIARWSRTRPTP